MTATHRVAGETPGARRLEPRRQKGIDRAQQEHCDIAGEEKAEKESEMMERAPGSGMPNPLKLVAREGMKHDGLSFQQSSACSPCLTHLDDSSHDTEDEGGHHHKGQRSHGSDRPLAWQQCDGEQQEGDTEQREDGRAGEAGHGPADLLGGRNCLSSGGGQCIAQFRRVRITMSGSWGRRAG
jgi:hypothetical protein